VLSKIETEYKHTTDTDSLFFCKSQINKIQDVVGNDFGQFKCETNLNKTNQGYFPAKKIYTVFESEDDNKIVKYKFKGVKERDWLVEDEEIAQNLHKLIDSKKFAEVRKISEDLPRFNRNIETIKKLCNKKKVSILCSQLRKNIKNVVIQGIYMIKEFDLNKNYIDRINN